MSNIAQVIGWKFNHQPGMRCKEIKGVMTITEFPGGVPSQEDQDLWVVEYDDHIAANPPGDPMTVDDLFDMLVNKGVVNAADRPGRP